MLKSKRLEIPDNLILVTVSKLIHFFGQDGCRSSQARCTSHWSCESLLKYAGTACPIADTPATKGEIAVQISAAAMQLVNAIAI
jgi:hypothetical protein